MLIRTIIVLLLFSHFSSADEKNNFGANDLIFSNSFEPLYFVGGVTTSANVVVKLNQFDDYTIPTVGSYVIPFSIEEGSDYQVVVVISPNALLCSASNNSGTINSSDITDVDITCGDIVTIYDVKQEIVTGLVAIENLIVTECKENIGYWVQTTPGDVDYSGDDYSGSYVSKSDMVCSGNSADVKVGDRISLNPALANNFFGQVQMIHNSMIVHSSNNQLPEPVLATTIDLSGIASVPLEGVLVKVAGVTVTDVQTPPGSGEGSPSNSFAVNNELIVDDIIYLTSPFPQINNTYDGITGIMMFTNGLSKLLPRFSQDVFQPIASATGLVINELDYDQVGPDTEEFIEIFNPTNSEISLDNITLYLINGSGNLDYQQIDLDGLGPLQAGQYLVIGSQNMIDNVTSGALTMVFDVDSNQVQNGPDGVVLINRNTLTVIDGLSYEGDIVTAMIADLGITVNVTEGASSLEDHGLGSIARVPNGQDTDDNDTDWVTTALSTPGSYNIQTLSNQFLVINEVDYDQVGNDENEFVEIFNPTISPITLSNLSLYLINGSNDQVYNQIDLDASHDFINGGQYLVVGSANILVTVPASALKIPFMDNINSLQNGAPDGLVLGERVGSGYSSIDGISYEGNMTGVTEGTSSLVDTGVGSLSRVPNGDDTDNNDADFIFTTSLTPGAENTN